jgi:hypothetical protein
MKKFLIVNCLMLVSRVLVVNAQVNSPISADAATPYAVVDLGADYRVWARTNYAVGSDGKLVPTVHCVTELGTGMHYLGANGQWLESKAEIDILPNGAGATATNGPHKVIFPPDIYGGQIELNTPDGKWLRSQVLGLSYYDTSSGQSVMIAELTNSTGVLQGQNVVLYPNAFTDFSADVRYIYTCAGLEQDIVLEQQIAPPSAYNLNPDTTHLEVLTEFFNPPAPTVLPVTNGPADETLDFGAMKINRGMAFILGDQTSRLNAVTVSKNWGQLEGRYFLAEDVPFQAIAPSLEQLPPAPVAISHNSVPPGGVLHRVVGQRLLPPQRFARQATNMVRMARSDRSMVPQKGYVLDYAILGGSTNFTFRGDTTYYVTNTVLLYGTTTLEGGAVIKYLPGFASGGGYVGCMSGSVICNTGPYRPAIFTSKNDDSVGESISGSTGIPLIDTSTASWYFYVSACSPDNLHDLRMSYGGVMLVPNSVNMGITNLQLLHTYYALYAGSANIVLENALIVDAQTGIDADGSVLNVQHLTTDKCGQLIWNRDGATETFTNCLLTGVTNWGATFTSCNNATNASAGVFRTVGAGNYYLATDSPYRNVGTTNIDPGLLAALRQKTTYPPIVYSNVIISANTTLSPQAQRDTDTPDLGYHYDPVDYIVDGYAVTNASLVITNGAAIAYYNDAKGIWLQNGSTIVSVGTPLTPNWIAPYTAVQEQSLSIGTAGTNWCMPLDASNNGALWPAGQYRFTKFTRMGGGAELYDGPGFAYTSLLVQDCEFWNGTSQFGGSTNTSAILKNNLFYRNAFSVSSTAGTNSLSLTNNLLKGIAPNVALIQPAGSVWYAFDNVFDTCSFGTTSVCTNGYNGYINCINRINPSYFGDLTNNTFVWLSGPLGNFYQTNASAFVDKGNVTADKVGLYHYTTQTNLPSTVEGSSTVDLGYHYVGVDANGNPLDNDSDGIPDYLEDANGNGVVDSGETDWQNANDLGLNVLILRPRNGFLP